MIGVFDSGVGGLTVVKEITKQLPNRQIIYFGDTARLPYGTKGADFVKNYSKKITKWLLDKGANVIVVACNTSSAWASESIKNEFKNTPVFEMITPAVKDALSQTKNNRIGIIGTPGTIKSNAYQSKLLKLDENLKIFSQPCPLLVPLVEEGMLDDKITTEIVKKYLNPLKKQGIDTLILGCTHYPLLESIIKKIAGKKIKVINPAISLSKELKIFYENNTSLFKEGSNNEFFFSDQPYNFQKISRLCLKKETKPVINDPF